MQTIEPRTKVDAHQTENLTRALQNHMVRYGYHLVETPIIEAADLFLTKAGDQVAEQLFTFDRHSHTLALRPEFTAAAAYRYVMAQQPGDVVRWQFSGPIFTDSPQQASQRQYQQQSAGAELIGADGPAADAEVMSMAVQGLIDRDVNNWTLVIGHVGLTRRLLARYQLEPQTQRFILHHRDLLRQGDAGREQLHAALERYFPRTYQTEPGGESMTAGDTEQMLNALLDTSRSADTMGGRTREDIARRLLKKRQQAAQRTQIDEAVYFLQGWMNINATPDWAMSEIEDFISYDDVAQSMFSAWQRVMELLDTYQIPRGNIIIQPDLARSWDYYTGLVFEIRTKNATQNDVLLAGGGRYDELTQLVGGDAAVPAVGFAYYLDRVQRAIPTHAQPPHNLIHIVQREGEDHIAARWAMLLRQREISTALVQMAGEEAVVVLQTQADGQVRLGDRSYSEEEIELLVTTLKGW